MGKQFSSVISKLLQESNFDLDSVVDQVIEGLGLGKFLEEYKVGPESTKWYQDLKANRFMRMELGSMTSYYLVGIDAEMAHSVKPVTLKMLSGGGHGYWTNNKEITFAFPSIVLRDLGTKGLNNTEVLKENPLYARYFNLGYWRGVIAHELTHWMEDALHNNKITRGIDKYSTQKRELNKKMFSRMNDKEWTKKYENKLKRLELDKAVTSGEETEAIIAQLRQIKRTLGDDVWNSLTFKDLYEVDSILKHYVAKAKGDGETGLTEREFIKYIQNLVKKMNRVDILGRRMRSPMGDM